MKDVFDAADPTMSSPTDTPTKPADAAEDASYVCPFCGLGDESAGERGEGVPCPRCGISDSPGVRKATKQRIGPWYVRQVRNPWAPGMKWETLLSLVKRGQVTANSIVRGPTTHQLWKRAAHVKGLSREFGLCFSCGEAIERDANLCAHCNRLQEPPANPDVLLETREVPAGLRRESRTDTAKKPESNGNGNAKATSRAEPVTPAPMPTRELEIGASVPPPAKSGSGLEITSSKSAAASDPAAEALLTAQELATAFKLDFTPRKTQQRAGGKAAKVILVLALLGISAACLLYIRPDYRESSWRWVTSKLDALKPAPPAPETAPIPPKVQTPQTPKQSITPRPVEHAAPAPASVKIAPTMPEPAVLDIPKPKFEISPMPATKPAEAVAVQKRETRPATKPVMIAPPPPPVAPPVATPPPVDPAEAVRTLWRKAIDAEQNQDFVEAVKCYQLIKKLPADVQPEGLDVRLELAKKQTR